MATKKGVMNSPGADVQERRNKFQMQQGELRSSSL